MCGIAGLVRFDGSPVAPATVERMTQAIAHRGPDGSGHWVNASVGIGHRRLAIIDPTPTGHQPMECQNRRFILSYNGEVYNYRELRSQLISFGHCFRGESDTEVVLTALAHWGIEAIRRFNGMFALALWDRQQSTLYLARDRYGVKPLYYARRGFDFSFGSEQKAILAQPDFPRQLNLPALLEYLTFQNLFTDQTLLSEIRMLPAGHYLVARLEHLDAATSSVDIKLVRYWDYCFHTPQEPIDRREYQEELDRLFKQAVQRQLVADVELGAYLSGGMDSGSITAIASQSFPYLKSFTCGFDLSSASGIELGFDERAKAEALSACFKTEHYEMVLKAGDMERCLPQLAWHLEEPRVGQSYPNLYAAKLASKFVKVVLSGSGGDELFGGYPWRYYRNVQSLNFEHFIDQYYLYWQRLVDNRYLKAMFAPVWSDVSHVWTRDIFRDVFATHQIELKRPEDYINHSLYFEAKTFLHGLFVVEDKLSMAYGLESRVPFMDNDLVDFAMRCPVEMKLNQLDTAFRVNENDPRNKQSVYFQKTSDGKQILRDVMSRYIPAQTANAIKQGFSSPDASWFKGESIDFVRRTLYDKSARIYDVLDPNAVLPRIDEHLRGELNRRLLIWSLLNLEAWMRAYL
ncbi:MAG: asparagine synthase (glutamine-hydrolyzing) [Planctomycetaceae bacterium]|nr:asparagine synthase (glutamine-hydrolyzing) [Planctomycetaceae bacterium]